MKMSLKACFLICLTLFVCVFQGYSQSKVPRTLTGNSGKSIETYGIKQEILGTWMGRSSWKDIADANWLMVEGSGAPKWKREHFDRPMDVGVPLIPTDSKNEFNELLKESISGSQDSTYISLGRNLAKYCSKTVYARLWWEFNMYPVKQDANLFVKAWQRAVPLIRKGFKQQASAGQTLHIVWCTNAGQPNPEPFYPGDNVVDVIGSDTYGMTWGDSDPTAEQIIRRIIKEPYMLEWQAKFADQHKKPTCIGEWGNVAKKGNKVQDTHGIGDCPEYIDAIYNWTKTCKYGCIYVCYFNLPDGGILTTLDEQPESVKRLKVRAAAGK
ncbi:glycosyl hydrolase [Mucilaginibacter gynuensis]|uniref:glycosyl hydrolase n=1 Tax=Mucilaginibacter gynuensis TaxID=1302236 RepID=UPI0031E688FF